MTHIGRGFDKKVAGWLALVLLSLCLLPGGVRGIQEVVVVDFGREQDAVPPGWELSEHTGKADLALVTDGSGPVLRLRSDASSFAIQKEVAVDLQQTPFLQWQWKVTQLPKGGDFRKSASDDQAAQLYVMFSADVLRTEVIAYIWDSTAPKGTIGKPASVPAYPFLRIRTVVVESGDTHKGKWVTVTRDLREDYKKLFGGDPDTVGGIRIQINSQHTQSQAESYWKSLTFKPQP